MTIHKNLAQANFIRPTHSIEYTRLSWMCSCVYNWSTSLVLTKLRLILSPARYRSVLREEPVYNPLCPINLPSSMKNFSRCAGRQRAPAYVHLRAIPRNFRISCKVHYLLKIIKFKNFDSSFL